MKNTLWIIGLVVLLSSCGRWEGDNPQDTGSPSPSSPVNFTPWTVEDSSRIDTFKSGLRIYQVRQGPGEYPEGGANVRVHYHGLLPNGEVFDSSFERDRPLLFTVGSGMMIPGFSEGIRRMKYGSRAILFIPPDLGYGTEGKEPNIPPNSALIFHVELLGAF